MLMNGMLATAQAQVAEMNGMIVVLLGLDETDVVDSNLAADGGEFSAKCGRDEIHQNFQTFLMDTTDEAIKVTHAEVVQKIKEVDTACEVAANSLVHGQEIKVETMVQKDLVVIEYFTSRTLADATKKKIRRAIRSMIGPIETELMIEHCLDFDI